MNAAILMYHAIGDENSPISITVQEFEMHMRAIEQQNYKVISLDLLLQRLRSATDPAERSIAITFDDGFASVYTHALPVLVSHGYPATVFLVTDCIGKKNNWPSRMNIPILAMLNWDQVREMDQSGIEFGAHTTSHPSLIRLKPPDLHGEILNSKKHIEDVLGKPVYFFAYPYGELNAGVKGIVQGAFNGACGTRLNFVHKDSDPYNLERIDVHYLRKHILFSRLHSPAMASYLGLRRRLRVLRSKVYGR